MTQFGTSNFVSFIAACKYYKPYGYNAKDVKAKIVLGSITIGRPKGNIRIIDGGRYAVIE